MRTRLKIDPLSKLQIQSGFHHYLIILYVDMYDKWAGSSVGIAID